ncbi:hypothetical protein ACJMK2_004095 [Sinanodonta woodiana]|uniref:CASP-like protein n=1 Tax=Sinanodonta woodiana TaxID=1069815 RepID=A0ABD3Y2T9_SINWO
MEGIINYINYIAVACSALSLILDIAAAAIPKWITFQEYQFGVWKFCDLVECYDLKVYFILNHLQEPDSLGAARAFLIISILLMAAAIVLAVLKMFVMKDNSKLSIGAAGSAIAAGLILLVDAIVTATQIIKNFEGLTADALSSGFSLAIVSSVIAIIAGILFFIGKNK